MGDGGPATSAKLSAPSGVAQLPDGSLLIADANNNAIRKVATNGIISTVVGDGVAGFTGDGGAASGARLAFPFDVAVTPSGGYLIADVDNNRIRSVSPGGTIVTVAGNGAVGSGGDGGPSTGAQLNKPSGIALTPDGGFLIADGVNNRVRKVSAVGGGTITTVAGNGGAGSSGDGGQATAAQINRPNRVAVLPDGGFLIAETLGNRIRRVAPDGTISTVAGTGAAGGGGDGGPATAAQFNNPYGVAVTGTGDYLVADSLNHRVREVDASDAPAPPPGSGPPLPPSAPEPENVTRPQIINGARSGNRQAYRCTDGAWTGLAAEPGFEKDIYLAGEPRLTPGGLITSGDRLYARNRAFLLAGVDSGKQFYCRVTARTAAGGTISATSPKYILSGDRDDAPVIASGRPYGSFRVRGIDVFQLVQPNTHADRFGFPAGGFPHLCGAGTPTSYLAPPFRGACTLGSRDPQRTGYTGVTLDQRKRTTAVVYVNMVDTAPSEPSVPITVTLRGRLGGRLLSGAPSRTVTNPPVAGVAVAVTERGGTDAGEQFEVPASWLAAAVLSGQRLDLETTASLPLGTGGLEECQLAIVRPGATACTAKDNTFRLDGVDVTDRFPDLTFRSLPLLDGDPLEAPEKVMAKAVELMPGGDRWTILPYNGFVDISTDVNRALTDEACKAFRANPKADPPTKDDIRGCVQAGVQAALDRWWGSDAGNRSGYNVLLAIHRYRAGQRTRPQEPEPGWKRGDTTLLTPGQIPTMAISDRFGRPTTPAHEFTHALGAPHSDTTCGGNSDGQQGESWPPDERGRLQGTAFGQNRNGARNTVPVVDNTMLMPPDGASARPLYDFMSYCRDNDNDWISPFTWQRAVSVLGQVRSAQSAVRSAAIARASVNGTAFVSGVVGPGGAEIGGVVPAGAGNSVPAPVAGSQVQVRALSASGAVLADVGADVGFLVDGSGGASTFVAPLPAGTTAVEARAAGAIDRVERTRPPSVRLLAPRAGGRVGGRGSLLVRWRAADPDTPPLEATVDYAADGRSFRGVWRGPSTGAARIPARYLEGSRAARVRVTVSDGFTEASAVSGRFSAAGSAPTTRIIRPAAGEALAAGARVVLLGAGLDDAQRSLRRGSLTWFDGHRRLGSGERLQVSLAPGAHVLRLVARDRAGRSRSVTRRATVGPVLLELTRLQAPPKVRAGASSVPVTAAASTAATLRAGGRRYDVGPRARRLSIRLPARPRSGVLRLSLRLTARGPRQRAVTAKLFVLRP